MSEIVKTFFWKITIFCDLNDVNGRMRGCPQITSAAGRREGVKQMLTRADEGGRWVQASCTLEMWKIRLQTPIFPTPQKKLCHDLF